MKESPPYSRFGFCQGCGKDAQLFMVIADRYRCAECSKEPWKHWTDKKDEAKNDQPEKL